VAFVVSPVDGRPYLAGRRRTFDADTERALKRFQADHHQAADGVYGSSSHRQLQATVRWRKRHGRAGS
jgi:murein L,D-transpeptidase YcbB/YkuD